MFNDRSKFTPNRRAPRRQSLLALVLFASFGVTPTILPAKAAGARPNVASEQDAFDLLGDLRAALRTDSPFTADFRQSLAWVDFPEDPEVESGKMAVSLPSCLRWDFGGDFAKSYLLCDDRAHSWSPGDARGRRTRIDDELALEAPGLDFFLLTVDELRSRYTIDSVERVAGDDDADEPALEGSDLSSAAGIHLRLTPLEPVPEVAQLEVVLDREARRIRVLSYVDAQGSRTTFELYGYRPGVERGAFTPPPDVEWEDS